MHLLYPTPTPSPPSSPPPPLPSSQSQSSTSSSSSSSQPQPQPQPTPKPLFLKKGTHGKAEDYDFLRTAAVNAIKKGNIWNDETEQLKAGPVLKALEKHESPVFELFKKEAVRKWIERNKEDLKLCVFNAKNFEQKAADINKEQKRKKAERQKRWLTKKEQKEEKAMLVVSK